MVVHVEETCGEDRDDGERRVNGMERRIVVTVRVSGEEHAERIKEDIETAVKMRTTVFYVSSPKEPNQGEFVANRPG